MDIDPAWGHDFACRIDHLGARRRLKLTDASNPATLDEDIRDFVPAGCRIDHSSAR
jgi:hypothetical protein